VRRLNAGAPLVMSNPTMLLSSDGMRLEIDDTKLADDGRYACVAANSAGSATHAFVLNVGVAPKIGDEPSRVLVNVGETAVLECDAFGVPEPTISWTVSCASLSRLDGLAR